MAKTTQDGKSIKLVLCWLTGQELNDKDISDALGWKDPSTYSKNRDYNPEFPAFEQLELLAAAFDLNPIVLQIAFGYRSVDELILLDRDGMHQYLEMGGGNYPNPNRPDVRDYIDTLVAELGQMDRDIGTL